MPRELNRRAFLRTSAFAGAGALTLPMLTGQASATMGAQRRSGGRPGGNAADVAADRIVASVQRPRFPDRYLPVTEFGVAGDGTAGIRRY